MLKQSQKTETGLKPDDPMVSEAFRYKHYADAGVAVGFDEIPNIVVLDLMEIIETQTKRLKAKKKKEMENKSRNAKR